MKAGAFFMPLWGKEVRTLSIYSQIKEQVTCRDVAEHYGYKVKRNGMMICPFHPDKKPSMKVDKNFYCFGCHEKGDVIRFAGKLFGLDSSEAVQKLITDMGLTAAEEKRPKTKTTLAASHCDRLKRLEEVLIAKAVRKIYFIYCDYYQLLNEWTIVYAPDSPEEEFHPLFEEAMHKRDYVEYILDILLHGSEEEKTDIVIEKGKEVTTLEKRIAGYKPGEREAAARDDDGAFS